MTITINENELEFSLEQEKTAGEVVEGINRRLFQEGQVIVTMIVNGRQENQNDGEDSAWRKIPVGQVDRIELETEGTRILLVSTVDEALSYCGRILNHDYDSMNEDGVTNLRDGMDWLIDAAASIQTVIGVDYEAFKLENQSLAMVLQNIQTVRDSLQLEDLRQDGQARLTLQDAVKTLMLFLMALRQKYFSVSKSDQDYSEQLSSAVDYFEQYSGNTEEISTLLQTGKEMEGLEKLSILISYMESTTQIIMSLSERQELDLNELTVEDQPFTTFLTEFQTTLKEIMEAFDNKDMVLISDLIEYEIPEKTEGLLKLLKRLPVTSS